MNHGPWVYKVSTLSIWCNYWQWWRSHLKRHRLGPLGPGRPPPWRAWQPTLVFLSGESHEQRSLEATVHGIAESERTDATKHASHTLVKCWCYDDDMLLLLVLALGETRSSYIQNRIFQLCMLFKINNLRYYHFVYNWFFKIYFLHGFISL